MVICTAPLLLLATSGGWAAPVGPGIFYPNDPEFIVLEYYSTGSATVGIARPRLRIHGDGRAIVHFPTHAVLAGTYEKVFERSQLDHLLYQLALEGVLDFDEKQVRAEIRDLAERIRSSESSTGRSILMVSDAGSQTMIVKLDQYDPVAGGESRTGFRKRVAWAGIHSSVKNYPEIEALHSLQRSFETLEQWVDAVRATGKQTGDRDSVEPIYTVITFPPKGVELEERAMTNLDYLAYLLTEYEESICFWIYGRCDSETDGEDCEPLAKQRAEALESYLVHAGVDPRQVSTEFPGIQDPPCTEPPCHFSNRWARMFSPGIAETPGGCEDLARRLR